MSGGGPTESVVQPTPRKLVVEADGGSRGNPGVAGSGALVRDQASGKVLVELARPLGQASNNVAEYTALIIGLEAASQLDPGAEVEVRMDSRLVVEQMSGRWKIKHEDMSRLATQARQVATAIKEAGGTVAYLWIPREKNKAADRLSNDAMDGKEFHRDLTTGAGQPDEAQPAPVLSPDHTPAAWPDDSLAPAEASSQTTTSEPDPKAGTSRLLGGRPAPRGTLTPADATRIVLVRHGVTDYTTAGRLDGRGGANPPLNAEGQRQARAVANGIRAFLGDTSAAVVSSSLARAHQTGQAIAAVLGVGCLVDPDWDELAFGDWDGQRLADIHRLEPEALAAAWADDEVARPGGESRVQLRHRVAEALRRAVDLADTVVVATHRGPIVATLCHLLGSTHTQLNPLMTAPASMTSVRLWPDGGVQVEFVNDTSHLR